MWTMTKLIVSCCCRREHMTTLKTKPERIMVRSVRSVTS
jgi:hypothetical protein